MIDLLLEWLAQYGYPVVFGAAALENIFPIGFLVPGEIVVLSAAAAASSTGLDPVVIALLALTGETLGEFVSYAIGRYAGTAIVGAVCRRFPSVGAQLARGEAYFLKRGAVALVIGRPAWGIKATLPVIAGTSRMPFWKVAALVTVSSLYYYPILVALAYAFGLGVQTLSGAARTAGIALTVILVLAVGFGAWRKHLGRARRTHLAAPPHALPWVDTALDEQESSREATNRRVRSRALHRHARRRFRIRQQYRTRAHLLRARRAERDPGLRGGRRRP